MSMMHPTATTQTHHRATVRRLVEGIGHNPRVLCLGPRSFDALPLDVVLSSRCRLAIVDRSPESVNRHLARRLAVVPREAPQCLLRAVAGSRAGAYCRGAGGEDPQICADEAVLDDGYALCQRYHRGREPTVHISDLAMGRGACFATRCEEIVARARSAKHATEAALARVDECARTAAGKLDLAEDSFDVIVALGFLPLFEQQPYEKFRRVLAQRFPHTDLDGRPIKAATSVLADALTALQVVALTSELYRLVRKGDGRVYVSANALRRTNAGSYSLRTSAMQLWATMSSAFDVDLAPLLEGNVIVPASPTTCEVRSVWTARSERSVPTGPTPRLGPRDTWGATWPDHTREAK